MFLRETYANKILIGFPARHKNIFRTVPYKRNRPGNEFLRIYLITYILLYILDEFFFFYKLYSFLITCMLACGNPNRGTDTVDSESD